MSRGVRAARRAFRWTRWLILALLLPVLLVAALGQWWLLPRLNDYRDDLTGALRDYLHLPVRIETVTAVRDGGHLSLRLQEISLHDPGSEVAFATFRQATVTLDLWRSLREWRPVVGDLRLEGANLLLEPGREGALRLRTVVDSGAEIADAAASLPDIARWLFGLRRLVIVGEQLIVRRPDGVALRFPQPYLKLWETPQGPRLIFTIEWPAGRGGRFEFALEPPSADRIALETGATGWRVQGSAWFEERAERVVTQSRFELTGAGEHWQGRMWDVRVEKAWSWLMPWLDEPARQWLEPLAPRGELPEITFQTDAGAFVVTVRLHDVAWRPGHGLPGFTNLSGSLEWTPERSRIDLDSRQVQIDTDGLLRAPVTLDTLAGVVSWEQTTAGLRFASPGLELVNADLAARVWGQVTLVETGETLLDLRGEYREVPVERAWRYLPVAVIDPEAVAWLDGALVGGRVISGEGILRGPAHAFPFDRDDGLFETRFQVEDAVLDYASGWPKVEGLAAQVTFRNRGLRIEASAGRLHDAGLRNLTAGIDDLENAVVRVQGRASGPGASLWSALQESPVGRDWDALPELRIDGGSTLDLDLTIPLDARPTRVRGRVGLADNRVTLPAWSVDLGSVRGEARFTESSLDARDLRAVWRGAPLRLDLALAGPEGRRELQTRLRGRLGLGTLLGESAGALAGTIDGASDWEALLTVPTGGDEHGDQTLPFTLDLRSNLRGVAVHLPAPLGKAAAEIRPLRIRLRPRERETLETGLEYGEGVRSALELTDVASAPRFVRGELRVNAGAARLPEAPGLTIIADLPRWELVLPAGALAVDDAGASPSTASPLTGLRRLEGRIGELVVGNQSFPRVTVAATRHEGGMRIELDGARLEGRITLPDAPAPQHPINASLRRVHLQSGEESAPREAAAGAFDPRRLPPLVLTVSELRRDEVELGRLRLVAMPLENGIRLAECSLESEPRRIAIDGDWRWTDRGPVSRLRATLEAQTLSEALTVFGYPAPGVARGETRAELTAEWAGAPFAFALEDLEGVLQFQVGPGQLLEIKPGLGRMVGLFNVQNLLRRLTLDFSDLFQPGTSFDRIAGQFAFGRGQAETRDLTIEAPAARIELQGRIGLRTRDYDQIITVTPRLGGTLPVAGALAGGPAVGAVVFVAERLLQKGIENVTRHQYALAGSWDDPVLERLDA
ncbi:MAG: YhdP family protein, partial [Candidatus Competibacteraceae bacterium]